eukprot:gene25440-11100_t
MEEVAHSIVAHSHNASDLVLLNSQLRQKLTHIGTVHNAGQSAAAMLQRLDQVQHSLGVLYMLEVQLRAGLNANAEAAFIDYVSQYLQVALKDQIVLAPDLFVNLCRKYKERVIQSGCPRKGILPLLSAIRTLQPSVDCATPIHTDVLQLCLLSKCYNAATPLLDEDILTVEPAKTCMTPTDLFLYCYYGRKQYARALDLLLQALTAPSMTGNAIVVAAYKKYVLTSLIHSGAVCPLPKFTPSKVRQSVESEYQYTELATAYATHSAEKLLKCIEQHANFYEADTNTGIVSEGLTKRNIQRLVQTYLTPPIPTPHPSCTLPFQDTNTGMDNNTGLVKLVSESLTKRNIQRLTQTYLTLSLGDIASQVGLSSANDAELQMLRDGMVNFLEDPEQYTSGATASLIDRHIKESERLAKKLQDMDDAVSCDRTYLKQVSVKERARYDVSENFAGASQMFQP